jgi:hypothetical protein
MNFSSLGCKVKQEFKILQNFELQRFYCVKISVGIVFKILYSLHVWFRGICLCVFVCACMHVCVCFTKHVQTCIRKNYYGGLCSLSFKI